ncbi:two-component regulator propeller domain-containing protein [Aliikangiella maris]|uniref:histidine kinase n=2 Tax=Aliikangiella maris TaxID=3162458 RepID=A0ABV3MK99_9GAMM
MYKSITKIFTFFLIICAVSQSLAFAQNSPSLFDKKQLNTFDPLKFKHLDSNLGLPQATIFCILKSSDGRIWVGTQSGLSWFDGYQFHTYRADPKNPHGLSDDFVYTIIEDAEGYLWIGTYGGGLNRLDPKTDRFVRFQNDINDPYSLSNNEVTSLFIDSQKRFWVGTNGGGLNLFNTYSKRFQRFQHNPEVVESIGGNNIKHINEDSQGKLWIALSSYPFMKVPGAGLDQFDPNSKRFTHFTHQSENPNSLSHNDVTKIFIDSDDSLWIGTKGGGINHFFPEENRFIHYQNNETAHFQIASDIVPDIIAADKYGLWIALVGEGIAYLNKQTGQSILHKSDPGIITSLSNRDAYSLLQDKNYLWVGTWWKGLNQLKLSSTQFNWLTYNPEKPDGFPSTTVRSVAEDAIGDLWMTSRKYGVIHWKRQSNEFEIIDKFPGTGKSWKNDIINRTFIDSENRKWFASGANGLYLVDEANGRYHHYQHDKENKNSLASNNIVALTEYPKGTLWIGSRSGGVSRLHVLSGEFKHYRHDPNNSNSLSSNNIGFNATLVDSHGQVWIGTNDAGLNRINPITHEVTRFMAADMEPSNSKNKISNNNTSAIDEDSQGNIWYSTYGSGVDKLSWKNHRLVVKNYSVKDGLLSNAIDNLVVDDNDIIWLTSSNGISRLDGKTGEVFNFDIYDGAMPGEYLTAAQTKGKDGTIYFAGAAGVNFFHPDKVTLHREVPDIWVNEFTLFNRKVLPMADDKATLNQVIAYTPHITLNYHQNVFGFTFSTLDFDSPMRSQYAYKMEGFNRDWIYTDANKRFASFTNLDAGDYVFKVKATNKNGLWNEQARQVAITVLPAPWKTWWAYSLYVCSMVLIICLFIYQRYKLIKEKYQTEIANQQIKTIEAEKQTATARQQMAEDKRQMAEKASQAKSEYLAMMSHEIRTPINGVIGTAGILSELPLTKEQMNYIDMIKVSGENLLYIVNDILDLSKLEAGKMTIEKVRFNLRDCIEQALDIFVKEIDEKKLELNLVANNNVPLEIISDSTRLRQVIVNLVGNAFKFTKKGSITVLISGKKISASKRQLTFAVQDTGKGIPIDKQTKIFEEFSQADDSTSRIYGGTGLGLTISQRIIKNLGGRIKVDSDGHTGTSFYFSIEVDLPTNSPSINTIKSIDLLLDKQLLLLTPDYFLDKTFSYLAASMSLNITLKTGFVSGWRYLTQNNRPDLIIVDHAFKDSEAKKFIEYCKSSSEYENIPVFIICTPKVISQHHEGYLQRYDHIISKPLKFSALKNAFVSLYSAKGKRLVARELENEAEFAKQNPMHILIADDNAVNQKVLMHICRRLGYQPDVVSNGKEVLAAVANKYYDLVITDMQMPEMGGVTAAKMIRKNAQYDNLKIVLASSDILISDKFASDTKLFHDVLIKPISLNALKNCLVKGQRKINNELTKAQFNRDKLNRNSSSNIR